MQLHLFYIFGNFACLLHLFFFPYDRYPYEAIHVITADGYVLLLERIPRLIEPFEGNNMNPHNCYD